MITTTEYTNLDQAYDLFNAELFFGQLPFVLITLQRKRGAMGYFSARRFKSRHGEGHADELALNPATFDGPDLEILQTLVHEMCHVWQEHFGQPSRSGYHNKQWAAKMIEVGLMPSDTGALGGKTTGQRMSDYVVEDGRFEEIAQGLLANGFTVQWMSRENAPGPGGVGGSEAEEEGETNSKNKVKYTCPGCKVNVWGKPGLLLLCGTCTEPDFLIAMEAENA